MTCTDQTTIGEIVAADYRAAAIFERYGIDFCCRGARTLREGCAAAGVAADEVRRDIDALPAASGAAPRFDEWDARRLIEEIVSTHHAYVRAALPRLIALARKIAQVHGARHPELARVADLVAAVAAEMTTHMMKEEQILFPYIVRLADAAAAGTSVPSAPFGSIVNPIRMMEAEHESSGNAMVEIRQLTGGYTPPADACDTYRVCLKELDAFERDLHAHVHLENNILFPKAVEHERRRGL